MTDSIEQIVKDIDTTIRKYTWLDFSVWNSDGFRLTIAGSVDFTYYHNLEIVFKDVFFMSGFFQHWNSDTTKTVFELPDKKLAIELNLRFEIEQGYQLFIFRTEDYKNDIYIAAREIEWNEGMVFYYERENLEANERIAEFVLSKSPKNI